MSMKMKNNLIPVAEPDLSLLEEKYLLEAYRSGWISSIGDFVDRFEKEFANFCNVKNAIAVANGTVALHLSLLAEGVGPGDEVIVPALTFVATAAAVKYCGADPVFVDSVPGTGTIDPEAIELAITKNTKAIIAVHLYGHPADMGMINAIADKHNIAVIEDAAEAHGAKYKGQTVGALGKMATFSFYGNKLITTGEGGIVVTNDDNAASKIRFLKDHGMEPNRRYWHSEVGYNYRMTNLQAAIGCAQLERYGEILQKKAKLLEWYRNGLKKLRKIKINPFEEWASPVPWLICAIIPEGCSESDRAKLIENLKKHNIDTRPYFYPLCKLPPYLKYRRISVQGNNCPVAFDLSERGLNLPSVFWLPECGERVMQVLNIELGKLS